MRRGSILLLAIITVVGQGCVYHDKECLVPGSGQTYVITDREGAPVTSGLLTLDYEFSGGDNKYAAFTIDNGIVVVPALSSVFIGHYMMVLPPWFPVTRYEYPVKTRAYVISTGRYSRPEWACNADSQTVAGEAGGRIHLTVEPYTRPEELANLEGIMRDTELKRGSETVQEQHDRERILHTAQQRHALVLSLDGKQGR